MNSLCRSTPPFFSHSAPPSSSHAHTLTSSFHLAEAVCTLNTPMQKKKKRWWRKRALLSDFQISFRCLSQNERCRGPSHTCSVWTTRFNRDGGSSSPALSSVPARKCFYNRSHLALFFKLTPPPIVHLYLSLHVCCDSAASRGPPGKSSFRRPTSPAFPDE